jgi:hypothetical protein
MSNSTFKDNHDMKLYQKALTQAKKNVSELESKIWKLDRKLSYEAFCALVPENAKTVVWQTLLGDTKPLVETTYESREIAIEKAFEWIYDGAMVHYGHNIRMDEKGTWHSELEGHRHQIVFVRE